MPSPFPGMDPYIEGQGWWGFCTQYIAQIERALAPLLRPRYVTFIEEHLFLVTEDSGQAGRVRPDVVVAERTAPAARREGGAAVLEAPAVRRLPRLEVEHQVYLEIRRRDNGRVVCVMELLSPINKAPGIGQQEYLAKRAAVIQSTAHLVELDLLRGGERLPTEPPLPPADYYVCISQAELRPDCGVWPVRLGDRLPSIPIPLSAGDAPVHLDLQTAFDVVYDAAAYADKIDYQHGADPPMPPEDADWAEGLLRARDIT
jgi:Protein of unknown function (DUF4058)